MPPPPATPDGSFGSQRAPIILPGFDYDEQLRLDFTSQSFVCTWLRRTYTAEDRVNRRIDSFAPRARESLLRDVRYGNNITLLFRVCSSCRRFLNSPDYWAAIASGFSTTADQVQPVVDTLVRARKTYLRRHVDARPRTAATAAVDQWINNLMRRAMDNVYRPTAMDTVFMATDEYFANAKAKFLQIDSASMLSRPVMDEPRTARKRSPSPTSAEPPPNAKRRPSETGFESRSFSPASASVPLPPLKTDGPEIRVRGQARQAYHTPTSANGHASDLADRVAVRGCARRDSFSSPPASLRPPSRDAATKSEFTVGELEQAQNANAMLRERVARLEQKLAAATAQSKKDEASGEMEKRSAVMERKLASMEDRPATKETLPPDVKAVLASFEEQLMQAEERRVKDMEKAQAMIASLESRLSVPVSEESSPKQADETIRDLQTRIASLEAKLPMPDVRSSVESKLAVAEAQLREESTRAVADITKRLASLEDRLLSAHDAAYGKREVDDLSAQILRVEGRLTLDEASTEEINNRLSALDEQHLESAKLAASKTFVEVNSKKLNNRLSTMEKQQREAAEHKAKNEAILKAAEGRIAALEIQGTRLLSLLKTVETPKTPKSPSPRRDVQHNMEDIWNKIRALPTMASVSEKTFQIEQHTRALLEKHQRDTAERLSGAEKNVGDAKAQIKGLLKLLDEVISGMAEIDGVTALEDKLATLSGKLDAIGCQSDSRDARVQKLERKVTELGSDVKQALRAVSSADMATRVQDLNTRVDDIEQSVRKAKNEGLASEVASLHDHCNMLNAGLRGLVCELTNTG